MSSGNSCAHQSISHHYTTKPLLISKQTDLIFCVSNKSKDDSTIKVVPPEERRKQFSKRSSSFKGLFLNTKKPDNTEKQAQSSTKSKFGNLVTKHLIPLRFLSSLKEDNKKRVPTNVSCPNLNQANNNLVVDFQNRPKSAEYNTDLRVNRTSPKKSELTVIRPPQLLSPSPPPASPKDEFLFTTSLTHSIPKEKCKSVQELEKNSLSVFKQKLRRSYSDQPNTDKSRSPTFPLRERPASSLKLSSRLQSRMYKNDNVSQILDYLYIGSVEAAYNEPLLCKLKIDSLVDMSNMSASQVPSSKKLHCPCLCGNEARHFRSRLVIRIDDKETEDIEQYFDEINKFIDGSKRHGRRVLIFSYNGNSRAPAAVIQYMMHHEEFLLRQAYNLVKNQRPSVEINQGFQNTLEALEQRVFPEAKPSVSFGNDYLNIADPQAIKCAWIDCDT